MVKTNNKLQAGQNIEEQEVNLTTMTNKRPNITDTGNTRKRIPRKSIESGKNIEISLVIIVTSIAMKTISWTLQPVDIIVANTNIHTEVISINRLTVSCNSGNRNRISGEIFVLYIAVCQLVLVYGYK